MPEYTKVCTSRSHKVPATKSACQVHRALRLSRDLHLKVHKVLRTSKLTKWCTATKSALQGPQSAAPATKSAHQDTHHAVLPRRFAARALPKTRSTSQKAAFARGFLRFLKSSHMSKSRLTAPATKSERAEDQHHVQSTAPATINLYIDIKPLQSPAPVTKSSHQNTKFPFRLPRKSDHQVRKCARHHNESAVPNSTRASLRSRNAVRKFRGA